jgi:hypothetical protein
MASASGADRSARLRPDGVETWRTQTQGIEGFLGHYVANEAFTRAAVAGGAPVNTDDLSPVEFGFARNLYFDANGVADVPWRPHLS